MQSVFDGIEVVSVVYRYDLPAVGAEACRYVFAECKVGAAFNGYTVAVVYGDKLIKLERAGERCGFARNAFLHAAVACEDICIIIDDIKAGAVESRRKVRFGNSHTHSHCEALTERACCCFDAACMAEFGMAGRLAAELTELLYVVHRYVVAIEVEKRVFEHRGMSCGKNEPVPSAP